MAEKQELENKVVTTKELCNIIDISPQRLSSLTKANIIPKKDRGQFELGKALRGYINHIREQAAGREGLDLTRERAREAKAKADKMEIELEEKEGNLARIDDMQAMLEDVFTNVKTRIMGIPTAIRNGDDPERVCRTVLEDLADGATVENVRKRSEKRKQ